MLVANLILGWITIEILRAQARKKRQTDKSAVCC
jgi:hypothetical protein